MVFKILRKDCCGLDIHKTWIFACIGITDPNGRTEYKQVHFSSFSSGPRDLVDWFAKYSCSDARTESTGKYRIPVFNILEETCWVTLVYLKYTKPQKGDKTNHKGAKWICDLYMCGTAKPSFIPPPDTRQLRDLMRYCMKFINMLTGEKNHAQNCPTVPSLKLDDVFSDVFGKFSHSTIQYVSEYPDGQFDVIPLIHRRCKHPAEEVRAAVGGMVSREQATKLRECLLHTDQLSAHRERIETEIPRLAELYPYQLELTRTVPGFAVVPLTAVALISEIGVDMSVFPSAKYLASWAGRCLRNGQGNKKVKPTRISRAGYYLRLLLTQIANVVIKPDRHPECRERYRRVKVRRGYKKAIIAVCRVLLTAVWSILSKLEPYFAKGHLADKLTEHSAVTSRVEGLALLRKRGYTFKDELAVESG